MTPRHLLEDPSLPHQIVLLAGKGGREIILSCNCLRLGETRDSGHEPIEARPRWESGEAYARWLEHMGTLGLEAS